MGMDFETIIDVSVIAYYHSFNEPVSIVLPDGAADAMDPLQMFDEPFELELLPDLSEVEMPPYPPETKSL